MKVCKVRKQGYSKVYKDGTIVCRFCDSIIQAGSQRCPACDKHRCMGRAELKAIGREICGGDDYAPNVPQVKSGSRGKDSRPLLAEIDSGDWHEQQREKNGKN